MILPETFLGFTASECAFVVIVVVFVFLLLKYIQWDMKRTTKINKHRGLIDEGDRHVGTTKE